MSTIAIRVDEELKEEATKLYKSMGLDMTTAIKLFLTQSVLTQSIPFTLKAYDSTCYDDDGNYITDERLTMSKRFIGEFDEAKAVDFDSNNPDVAWLLEE